MSTWTTEDRKEAEKVKMKNFDIELFVKDLDKLFNDMQDKAIVGSENVATASWVIKNQAKEIEYWKEMFEKAMEVQEK
jgi:hypothetical protein